MLARTNVGRGWSSCTAQSIARLGALAVVFSLATAAVAQPLPPCENTQIIATPSPDGDCCYNIEFSYSLPIDFDAVEISAQAPVQIVSVASDPFWNEYPSLPTSVLWEPVSGPIPNGPLLQLAQICFDPMGVIPQVFTFTFYVRDPATGELRPFCETEIQIRCAVTGTICGSKFHDVNANGVWDAGEPALPNWQIQLVDSASNTYTAYTDANGHYCFQDVLPGPATVTEVMQAGWTQTYPASGSHNVNVVAGQSHNGLDFGNTESCMAITQDKLYCEGDAGFVYHFIATNLSDCEIGSISFAVLSPAGVTISSASFPPLGFGQTIGIGVFVSGPGAVAGAEVCFIATAEGVDGVPCCRFERCITLPDCPVTICGSKWRDRNNNSQWDAWEPGLPGWTIVLMDENGVVIQTTVTDANGDYCFYDLPPGRYIVAEDQQPGWSQTFPFTVTHRIELASGEYAGGIDFGNTRCKRFSLPQTTVCLGGINDNFAWPPEASSPSLALLATMNVCSAGPLAQFDAIPGLGGVPQNRCFGHTFSGCWRRNCLVIGARLTIRLKAGPQNLAPNDTLSFREDGAPVWGCYIRNLPGAGGTWTPGQDLTVTLDLANLPAAGGPVSNILATLQDGDFDVFVQDDSGVDFARLEVDTCCGLKPIAVPVEAVEIELSPIFP